MLNWRRLFHFVAFGFCSLPAAAYADVDIAVVGAMSGPFTKIGQEFQQGTKGAVEAINETGGLLGEKINVLVRDDSCDADTAKEIAEELAELNVAFVMGHLCSDASIAASDIYEKNGIIQISPASTNPDLTERGLKSVFRTTGRDDTQGFVIAEHILRSFQTKTLGIVYGGNSYSRGVAEVAKSFLNQGGMQEAFFEEAPPEEPYDFSAIFERIRGDGVNLVLYPGLPGPIISFLTQAKQTGVDVQLVGGDAFTGLEITEENRRLFDGVQFSFQPDPADDRRNKKLTQMYVARGYYPESFTFYSYAAVQIWSQAVERAESLDAVAVAETLRTNTFDSVLGEVAFDAKGDISNPGFVMYFFNKGKRYYVE